MGKRILEGIRVLDFTIVWAGPYAARMLAEMGAEVICIEHPRLAGWAGGGSVGIPAKIAKALGMEQEGIDPNLLGEAPWYGIRGGFFNSCSVNKRFIALDQINLEGREVLNGLVKISDVVIENLTPDVAHKLGISYEQLRQVNPQIIKCAMPGFGDGPWANYGAYGNSLEYLSGISSLTGYGYEDGDQPMPAGVFTVDPVGAMQAVAAIICALMYRKRTGKGMGIEVSQYEGAASLVNRDLLDYTMNKRVCSPIGNNDRDIAFQGCYRAKGEDDQWVVLSIRNQTEWATLCHIIGKEEWLKDERFSQPTRLEANREEVNAAITDWTTKRTKHEAARFLQNINIPAAPVNNIAETIFDPQLRHRGLYKWIEFPYGAVAPTPHMPVKFTKTPFPEDYQPPKAVGADNYYVYHDLVGLSESGVKELEDKKIIKR